MKTIEERAEELYPYPEGWEWHKNEKWAIDPYGAQRDGYIKGATEQKAIDIEKACKVFKDFMWIQYGDRIDESMAMYWKESITKAMEE